jgi:hypothetical protein
MRSKPVLASREADTTQMIANDDPHNEITLTAFRLVTMDLLELFKVMNEGTINILGKFSGQYQVHRLTVIKSTTLRCRDPMRSEL